MPNMSYCRFENTLGDLQECLNAIDDRDISSDREKTKAKKLLKIMAEYLVNGLIDVDENNEINIDYDAIDELIEECGEVEED